MDPAEMERMLASDNRDDRVQARRAVRAPTDALLRARVPFAVLAHPLSPSSRPRERPAVRPLLSLALTFPPPPPDRCLPPRPATAPSPPLDIAQRIAARLAEREAEAEEAALEAAANAEGAPIEPRKPKKPADGGPPRVSEERRAANESRRRLARLRASGEADVTSTRVAVDARESERREEAESRRAALRERRDGEAEASAARDAEVEQSWSRIFADATVPTELRDALEAQRKACDEVIAAKDAMADEIREELKLRDEGYVKALKRQAEDVDALVATMRARFGS